MLWRSIEWSLAADCGIWLADGIANGQVAGDTDLTHYLSMNLLHIGGLIAIAVVVASVTPLVTG
jgi:hypothetical protein